jgi:hypothetical protein
LPKNCPRATIEGMADEKRELRTPTVQATTLPFFARAVTIVDETWRDLDQAAGLLDRWLGLLDDSPERALLERMSGGIREVARRLEQTEVALTAYLPAP